MQNVTSFKDRGYPCVYDNTSPEEYQQIYRADGTPIIIDNGSYEVRCGWATDTTPRLRHRNLLARSRAKRACDCEDVIGKWLSEYDQHRLKARSQFDSNFVTNFEMQETLLDYCFEGLGLGESPSVPHPIYLTEAMCTPNYTRHRMSELFFECYNANSVAYGVDFFHSYNYNCGGMPDGLIVSASHSSTHVCAVLDGKPRFDYCTRVDLGAKHMQNFVLDHLNLAYQQHRSSFSAGRVRELIELYGVMPSTGNAIRSELLSDEWRVVIQLPYEAVKVPVETEEEKKGKLHRKQQNILRLKEQAGERRRQKLEEEEAILAQFLELKKNREEGIVSEAEFNRKLKKGDFDDERDFLKSLKDLQKRIAQKKGEKIVVEEQSEEIMYPLLCVSDSELNEVQKKEKKRQRLMRNAAVGRKRKQKEKEVEEARTREKQEQEEKMKQQDPAGYLKMLHQKRNDILQRSNQGMKGLGRKAIQRQKRQRLIAAMDSGKDKNFGADDDDWLVYGLSLRAKDRNSDSVGDAQLLEEYECKIREIDPDSLPPVPVVKDLPMEELYQVDFFAHRFQAPESLYQPSILGQDQAGLAQVIETVLSRMPSADAQRVVDNVFVCGGVSKVKGFHERLKCELVEMRPFNSSLRVTFASDIMLDAWRGAKTLANSDGFSEMCMTRQDYEEMGCGYLIEHGCSNIYTPTPQPIATTNTTGKRAQGGKKKKK